MLAIRDSPVFLTWTAYFSYVLFDSSFVLILLTSSDPMRGVTLSRATNRESRANLVRARTAETELEVSEVVRWSGLTSPSIMTVGRQRMSAL
jgi:hypothetical protein